MKVFVGVSTVLLVTAYPIFFSSKGGEQGEHYFSQEKPEAIARAQETAQQEYREKLKQRREEGGGQH